MARRCNRSFYPNYSRSLLPNQKRDYLRLGDVLNINDDAPSSSSSGSSLVRVAAPSSSRVLALLDDRNFLFTKLVDEVLDVASKQPILNNLRLEKLRIAAQVHKKLEKADAQPLVLLLRRDMKDDNEEYGDDNPDDLHDIRLNHRHRPKEKTQEGYVKTMLSL